MIKTAARSITTLTLLVGASLPGVHGQVGANVDFPRYTQHAGTMDPDGFPTGGAKLCLAAEPANCFQLTGERPPGQAKDDAFLWQFGLSPQSERLPLAGGGSWVFFTGTFSAGGSGTLERLAVLRMENGKIVNLMPFVGATNVSERAMWNLPEVSPYPVLVHADFLWAKNESHFEPHFFTVEGFRYDAKTDRYAQAFTYHTQRKYGQGEEVHVLKPERAEIVRRFAAIK